MTIDKLEIYNRALEKYGFSAQRLMLVEECGELLNAISKLSRNRATKEDIITELADVHIMVEQMALFFGWDAFVDEKLRKLIRLDERMSSGTTCMEEIVKKL